MLWCQQLRSAPKNDLKLYHQNIRKQRIIKLIIIIICGVLHTKTNRKRKSQRKELNLRVSIAGNLGQFGLRQSLTKLPILRSK